MFLLKRFIIKEIIDSGFRNGMPMEGGVDVRGGVGCVLHGVERGR
jgi:hypothetical protein